MGQRTSKSAGNPAASVERHSTSSESLHRVRLVREEQGCSLRKVARLMTKPVSQVRREEQGSYDLTLSDLQRWQRALGVPAADLLVEPDEELSDSVAQRASLVKIMKTAAAICEQSSDSDARRAGEEVIQQLVELMPELKDVKPWERVGKRRGGDELGRAAEQMMAEEWILGDQPARFD